MLLAVPFNSGILATGTAADPRYYYQPAPPEIVERVGRIEAVCARHEAALPAAALQFPLRHPEITAVLPGLQSAHQARSAISPSSRRRSRPRSGPSLEALGLLRPAAPAVGS